MAKAEKIVLTLTRRQAAIICTETDRVAITSEDKGYRRISRQIVDKLHDAMGYKRRNWPREA